MARVDEPPTLCLGMLFQHEIGPEQRNFELNINKMIEDDEEA